MVSVDTMIGCDISPKLSAGYLPQLVIPRVTITGHDCKISSIVALKAHRHKPVPWRSLGLNCVTQQNSEPGLKPFILYVCLIPTGQMIVLIARENLSSVSDGLIVTN